MTRFYKNRKFLYSAIGLLLAVAALLSSTVPALAARGDRGRWWNSPAIAKQLQLTDSEIQQLDEMYDDARLRMIELRGQLNVQRLKLRQLLGSAEFDIVEVLVQRQKEKQLYSRIADERFAFLLKARKVIGYERFKKLMDIQEARSRQHHEKRSGDGAK